MVWGIASECVSHVLRKPAEFNISVFICDFGSLVWTWPSLVGFCLGSLISISFQSSLVHFGSGTETEEGYMGVVSGTCFICSLSLSLPSAGCIRATGNHNWRKRGAGSRCQRMGGGKNVQEETVRLIRRMRVRECFSFGDKENTTARGDGTRERSKRADFQSKQRDFLL